MKCEECQTLIEGYADGALDQEAAKLVNLHVAACASCASFYQEVVREQEIYSRYQRDVEATAVLWSSIEARIKQDRAAKPTGLVSRLGRELAGIFAAPRLSPGFAAALVIIAIGITVGVMTYLNPRNQQQLAGGNNNSAQTSPGNENNGSSKPAPEAASPTRPEVADAGTGETRKAPPPNRPGRAGAQKFVASTKQSDPAQLVREAEQKYLAAIALLSRDVDRHRSQLDPIMLARFDAALGDIDRTIKDTRRVVRDNPGDPIALQYLLAAYSKKVDVLREMTLTDN